MKHPALLVLTLSLIAAGATLRGEAQNLAPTVAPADHVTSLNPDGTLQDQVRFLVRHWPRDFEIAVVEALDQPKCQEGGCSLRVRTIDVVLGHRLQPSYVVSYGPAKETSPTPFEVKKGDKLVAMLTPMIHPPKVPAAYLATYLNHADDALVESVREAVVQSLMSATCESKP